MMRHHYKQRRAGVNIFSTWCDAICVGYTEGTLIRAFGYDEVGTSTVSKEHWESTDGGATWVQKPEIPFAARDGAGYGVIKNEYFDNELVIWGGSGLDNIWARDVVAYKPSTGWRQVTADYGIPGNRQGITAGYHNGYMYLMNGYGSPVSVKFNDGIYRSRDGITWTNIAPTPEWLVAMDNGRFFSHKGVLYHMGGGNRTPNPKTINTKVSVSYDDGLTWSILKDDPVLFNSALWSSMESNGRVVVYNSGSNQYNNLEMDNRMLISENMTDWYHLPQRLPFRHASGICPVGEDMAVVAGYGRNDCWIIKKIS